MTPARETTGCVTTTPPRPPYQPPTVVETCPTPPSATSAATTPSRRVRRRPLLHAHADGCIVGVEEAILPSSSSSSSLLPAVRTPGSIETIEQVVLTTTAAANADVARNSSLDLPNGWRQTDPSFARQPRRTPRHSTDTTTTTTTPPLPDLDPADLISALLAQSLPVSASHRSSSDSPHSAATSFRSERFQTDYSRCGRSGSATPVSTGAGLSPPPPLSNRSRPVSPRSPPLRAQPSTTTLFSWDLAHLPAPDAPREKPYRVSWRSVLLPTRYLGGGRGSGRYGDQWGPVERKTKKPPPSARSSLAAVEGARSHPAEGEDGTARSDRRWSGRRSAAAAAAATAAARASSPAPSCSPTSGGLAIDSSASLASREPKGTPSEETRRRPNSILRRLSRSSVASWAAGSASSTTDRKPATISRRQSLVASLFGAKSLASKRSGEEKDLHQWVSVVLK